MVALPPQPAPTPVYFPSLEEASLWQHPIAAAPHVTVRRRATPLQVFLPALSHPRQQPVSYVLGYGLTVQSYRF
jgi:hypothetical protein